MHTTKAHWGEITMLILRCKIKARGIYIYIYDGRWDVSYTLAYTFTKVAEERRVSVNYVIAGINIKDMGFKLLAHV